MREGVPEKARLLEQDIAAVHTLWRVKLQSQTFEEFQDSRSIS
jgi:hypothetical protein